LQTLTEDNQLKMTGAGITVLDDTIDDIQGEHVEGVSIVKDSKNKTRKGHQLVTAHYKDDKKDFPLLYRLYQQKKKLLKIGKEDEFYTKIQLAIEILTFLIVAGLISSTIVFDTWYCSAQLINFLQFHELFFVSRLKSNRKVLWQDLWLSVDELFSLIPSTEFKRTVFYTKQKYTFRKKKRKYWTVYLHLQVQDLGLMTLILSKKKLTDTTGYVLITNNDKLSTEEICFLYSQRWSVEVFYRDAKQELHLGSVIFTRWTAYHRHYYFVFWTYLLLMYLSCYGIIQRQRSLFTRSTAKLKKAFRDIASESLILSVVRRAAGNQTAKVVRQLLQDRTSWSYFQTAL